MSTAPARLRKLIVAHAIGLAGAASVVVIASGLVASQPDLGCTPGELEMIDRLPRAEGFPFDAHQHSGAPHRERRLSIIWKMPADVLVPRSG